VLGRLRKRVAGKLVLGFLGGIFDKEGDDGQADQGDTETDDEDGIVGFRRDA